VEKVIGWYSKYSATFVDGVEFVDCEECDGEQE
jgi:hypothetical protein